MLRKKYTSTVPRGALMDLAAEFGVKLDERDLGLMERVAKDKLLVDSYQDKNDYIWKKIVYCYQIFYPKYVQNSITEEITTVKQLYKYYENELLCAIHYNYDIESFHRKLSNNP